MLGYVAQMPGARTARTLLFGAAAAPSAACPAEVLGVFVRLWEIARTLQDLRYPCISNLLLKAIELDARFFLPCAAHGQHGLKVWGLCDCGSNVTVITG